jgi:hypothetical protein
MLLKKSLVSILCGEMKFPHSLLNNEERCSGLDRRKFSDALHIPEGRCGKERRSGLDRRINQRASSQNKAFKMDNIKEPVALYH